MATYRTLLSRVAGRLDAPHRARVRIVEELAADLELLHEELVAAGLPPAEARRRAERMLGPSPEVLEELSRVHRPPWQRWAERYGGRLETGERGLLVAFTLVALGAAVGGLWSGGLLRRPSAFVWPVLVLAALTASVAVVRAVALWGGWSPADRSKAEEMDGGLVPLIVLPLAAIALALLGSFVGLWDASGALEANPDTAIPVLVGWIRQSMGLLATSLTLTLAAGLAWMGLRTRAARVEWAESALRAGRVPGRGPVLDIVEPEKRRPA